MLVELCGAIGVRGSIRRPRGYQISAPAKAKKIFGARRVRSAAARRRVRVHAPPRLFFILMKNRNNLLAYVRYGKIRPFREAAINQPVLYFVIFVIDYSCTRSQRRADLKVVFFRSLFVKCLRVHLSEIYRHHSNNSSYGKYQLRKLLG